MSDPELIHRIDPGNDAFVLGYPQGYTGGGRLPIWKRATIASHLTPADGVLRIDTATRPGMSGGPVFSRQIGVLHAIEGGSESFHAIGEDFRFVGCYISRPLHDEEGMLADPHPARDG